MLCDVASIFVVRTLIVSMVLTLIDNTRIHIFMYSIPRRHFTCPFTDLLYKGTAIHDSNILGKINLAIFDFTYIFDHLRESLEFGFILNDKNRVLGT